MKVSFIYRNSRKLFPAEADQKSFMNLIKGVKAQPRPRGGRRLSRPALGAVGLGPRSVGARAGDP